jgi:hypothetical protein
MLETNNLIDKTTLVLFADVSTIFACLIMRRVATSVAKLHWIISAATHRLLLSPTRFSSFSSRWSSQEIWQPTLVAK